MFRKTALACLGTLAAVALTASPAAHADPFLSGAFTVTDWTGATISDNAALPPPTSAATASFTYTGNIDFANSNSTNLFRDFFATGNGTISNYTGALSQSDFFNKTAMSTGNYATTSYLEFTSVGSYTVGFNTQVSVSHDDGASFYDSSELGNPIISSKNPTTEITNTATLPVATDGFTIAYVEANGAPADLIITTSKPLTQNPPSIPVPEPGSFALLGTGLLLTGLAAQRRRRGRDDGSARSAFA